MVLHLNKKAQSRIIYTTTRHWSDKNYVLICQPFLGLKLHENVDPIDEIIGTRFSLDVNMSRPLL